MERSSNFLSVELKALHGCKDGSAYENKHALKTVLIRAASEPKALSLVLDPQPGVQSSALKVQVKATAGLAKHPAP